MKLIDLLVKELPKRGGWHEGAVEAGFLCGNTTLYFVDANSNCPLEWRMEMDSGVEDNDIEISAYQYETALAAGEGWIEWGGGERPPVATGTMVDVKLRSRHITKNRTAGSLEWKHYTPDGAGSIIAYRLHNPDINSRANDDRLEQDLNECIGQDVDMPEWNGEGLPPVGCECEVKSGDTFADYDWVKIKVAYSHMGELTGIVDMPGESIHNDMEKLSAGYCGAIFRPLRTESEKARDSAVDAMQDYFPRGGWDYDDICSLYDAIAAGKIPGVKLETK